MAELGRPAPGSMLAARDTEEFRRHAHAFVDWMADYLARVERYPARAPVKLCQGTPRGKPLWLAVEQAQHRRVQPKVT